MTTNTTPDHINVKVVNKPSKLPMHIRHSPVEQSAVSFVTPSSNKKLSVVKPSLSNSPSKKPQLSRKMKRFLEIDVGSKVKTTKLQQSIQPSSTKRRYMRRGSSTPSMIAAAAAASVFNKKTSAPALSDLSR